MEKPQITFWEDVPIYIFGPTLWASNSFCGRVFVTFFYMRDAHLA